MTSIVVPTMVAKRAPIKELRRYDAIEFVGLKGVDMSMVEIWLESTTIILQQLKRTPQESVICVVSLLQGEAYTWWQVVTQDIPKERAYWEFFQTEF